MDKLVITVTVDSTITYPGNPYMPAIEDVDSVVRQYVDAVNAGASICHHHGIHYLESEIQPDGRKLSQIDFDGWQAVSDGIRAGGGNPIIQYGIASARLPAKVELMKQAPDMMSWSFNPHDEYFRPDPAYPAAELYALHPRDELREAASSALEHGVKLEIECFVTGAYWNLEFIRDQGLLENPVWATIFFNWQGAQWTPPTPDAVLYMSRHLPSEVKWSASVMDPERAWSLIPVIIAAGGHVRVGWEDNPYLPDGQIAKQNAQLVETVVEVATKMGRAVATPEEARAIVGL
jgi:3-keto-5-aminohexanoate cleavage enzyme